MTSKPGQDCDPSRELDLLRARLRHGSSVICDRCGDTLTLSSMTVADVDPHLLRTALELGWQLRPQTIAGLGGIYDAEHDRDLCSTCRKLVAAVPPKSR